MNPPAALQSAMSRERKPFTYTPGGIDLSEIKSERMAKRLMRNAMNQGVPEQPVQQSQPATSAPIAVPNFNCLPVQVFPTLNIPANPKSLLRTRSNPGPREPVQRAPAPPPAQIENNVNIPESSNYNIYKDSTPTYLGPNYNRPTSMFDYNSTASFQTPTNYSTDAYSTPYSETNKGVQSLPRKYSDTMYTLPSNNVGSENNFSTLPESFNTEQNLVLPAPPKGILKKEKPPKYPLPPVDHGNMMTSGNSNNFTEHNYNQTASNNAVKFDYVPANENSHSILMYSMPKPDFDYLNSYDSFSGPTATVNNGLCVSSTENTSLNNDYSNSYSNDNQVRINNFIKAEDTNDDSSPKLESQSSETMNGKTATATERTITSCSSGEGYLTSIVTTCKDNKATEGNIHSKPENSLINTESAIESNLKTVVPDTKVTQPIEDLLSDIQDKSEKKVVKKESIIKGGSNNVEKQNGNHNEDGNTEAVTTVSLPSNKSASKTETKVEVTKKTLPDGSIEEIKKTITKTTIDGRTETKIRTETTVTPKEEWEEEEIVEEVEGIVEEVDDEEEKEKQGEVVEVDAKVESTQPEQAVIETSNTTNEKSKVNGTVNIIKSAEQSETTTTTTKRVVFAEELNDNKTNKNEEVEEEEEEDEEIEEEEVVEEVNDTEKDDPAIIESKKTEDNSQSENGDEIQLEEEEVESEKIENVHSSVEKENTEEESITEDKVVSTNDNKPSECEEVEEQELEEEIEEEEEYEEAEEKVIEEDVQQNTVKENTEDVINEVSENKSVEEAEVTTETNVAEESKDVRVEEKQEQVQEVVEEKQIVIETEEKQEKDEVIQENSTPTVEKPEPIEHRIPIREPSVPLEKVEDVEIKPIGACDFVTKTHTEIFTSNVDKPNSLVTEFNRVENTTIVNRTSKVLDQAYESITQQGIPTLKSYFTPQIDKISTSPLPSRPYQSVYPSEPTTERRHSLLLERLSVERQMPSDLYQSQYSSQTVDHQRQISQEPQAEVLTVSNVKPSQITNQQWYQHKDSVTYNNAATSPQPPTATPTPAPSWTQPKPQQQPLFQPQPQYQQPLQSQYEPAPQHQYQPPPQHQYQPPPQPQYQQPSQPKYQPPSQQLYQPPPQPQYQSPPQPQYQPQPKPQYQAPASQLSPQVQYQPTYTENIQESKSYQNTYSSYGSKSPSWATNNSRPLSPIPTINVSNTSSQYNSYLNSNSSESYQKTSQQYSSSSSYVPPPWEQDSNYAVNTPQNYSQAPPQTNTFTPAPGQGWKPTPPPSKFNRSTSYIPPKPNQSFVKPVTNVEPPKIPGRKTYYSEYERRFITVPESHYVAGEETKFQAQPDASPQYYYDNNEPTEPVEPQWRRELREFTEKTQTQTQTTNVKPPWEGEAKYGKTPEATYTPTPTWSQTLRPQSRRQRSFESEYVSQEWPKTNTLGRGRNLSSYGKETVSLRTRSVSVDRYNPTSYQAPAAAEHPPVQTHTHAPPAPHAAPYTNPNVPAYHLRASAEPREQVSYQQPRSHREPRASPFQSRSFKYLQWITGTED